MLAGEEKLEQTCLDSYSYTTLSINLILTKKPKTRRYEDISTELKEVIVGLLKKDWAG